MSVNNTTLPDITIQYKDIITYALNRALHLEAPGLIFEFETLIENREITRIDSLRSEIESIPVNESVFVEEIIAEIQTAKFIPSEYGL
jgi:hypothetical protein